jgi:cytidine deaminase
MTDARALLDEAREVAERAYAPYSNFRVGAVVIAEDGRRFTGVNVENAAYGSSVCAESTAIVAAVSAGVREIDTVAVGCLDGGECTPCGNCRQIMREFGVKRVIIQNDAHEAVEIPFAALLPRSFGPESLETDG